MAVVGTPVYAQTLRVWACQVTAANANRDGATGAYVTLLTAGAAGAELRSLRVTAAVAVTDGVVRVFVQPAGSGAFYLVYEIEITATTPSGTDPVFSYSFEPTEIRFLTAGTVVKCSTENSEAINVIADGGDY